LYSLPQKLLAEFIGTFTLVFAATGAICADQTLRAPGQGGPRVLAYALAYGLAAAVMVSATGHISGGHLNPAISIGFWVTKRLGTFQALFYCVAQLLGAVAAAYLLAAILPETTWRPVSLGSTDLGSDFTRMHGMLFEAILTFFVVFVYFASAVDVEGALHQLGGIAVGLTITMGVLVGQPFTGASMNPARTFGPALAGRHWINHGVFWVGPLFGGIIAAVVYDRFFLRDQPSS
jgi:MIP family channel proteins